MKKFEDSNIVNYCKLHGIHFVRQKYKPLNYTNYVKLSISDFLKWEISVKPLLKNYILFFFLIIFYVHYSFLWILSLSSCADILSITFK